MLNLSTAHMLSLLYIHFNSFSVNKIHFPLCKSLFLLEHPRPNLQVYVYSVPVYTVYIIYCVTDNELESWSEPIFTPRYLQHKLYWNQLMKYPVYQKQKLASWTFETQTSEQKVSQSWKREVMLLQFLIVVPAIFGTELSRKGF